LVGLTPAGTAVDNFAGAATISGNREFEAKIFSTRLGPYLDWSLTDRLTFSLSGGLLVQVVSSDLSFNEKVSISPTVTIVGLPGESHHGSGSASDVLVGGYVSGRFSYNLTERINAFAGAQFQSSGDYSQTVSGKTAVLNLSQAVLVNLGLSYSF
jgi:hypothetical protein